MSDAIFLNTGQVCLCAERVYVERPIFDWFVSAMKQKADSLKIGWPADKATQPGPAHLRRLIAKKCYRTFRMARELGATIVTGGGVPVFGDARDNGSYVQPTILTGLR